MIASMMLITCIAFFNNSHAQSLRNEWIDFGKTYYRFSVTPSVAPTGTPSNHINTADYNKLHRISYTTLQAYGLENTPVEHFQLWRNGVQVPIYTAPQSGSMPSDGFLEFWGRANDGATDSDLYRFAIYQPNDRWSMFSDTAYYYLTLNAAGPNLRITNTVHDPLNSALTPDSFFMHTIRVNPRASRNLGTALNFQGTEVRSASWDAGEGWSEARFGGTSFDIGFGKLFANKSVDTTLNVSFWAQRLVASNDTIFIRMNNVQIGGKRFNSYRSDSLKLTNIPLTSIDNNDSTYISIKPKTFNNGYRYYTSKILFTYPRKFEFDKKTEVFVFTIPANTAGNLLKIVNFDTSLSQKILIDETNKLRYEAVRVADTLWFALEPSSFARSLILTSVDTSTGKNLVQPVTQLTARTFINYSLPENQGNYLIISNNRLYNDNGENHVEAYRAYRASTAGGNYNAKIYDIDLLTEQFGNNIRKHPIAIRNFLRYSRSVFTAAPKAALLIGRGATYNYSPTDTNINRLNLIPTWGHPASDNLLAAANNETITPAIQIGRVAAITGAEVRDYLEKVMDFEALQASDTASKYWQKEMLHLIGANDLSVLEPIRTNMLKYENIIKDTLVGAKVTNYIRQNDPNTAANNAAIQKAIQKGTGLLSYFGHSSATSFDFNLNDPEALTYTKGRLPVFLANGCKAAEFFDLNTMRYNQAQLSLSERFVFAKNKGSIAFISSTHYGILQYLDFFTEKWYNSLATTHYSKSIGEIHQEAMRKMLEVTSLNNPYARVTAEEYHLHGDPVIRMHSQTQPDYTISANDITITPAKTSVGNDTMTLQLKLFNAGKATFDSLDVHIERHLPNGNIITIADTAVLNLTNEKVLQFNIAVGGRNEAGNNQIKIQLDTHDHIAEANEGNNVALKTFEIAAKGITPILPQNFGIVNTWPTALIASPYDIVADSATYRMQLDTTTAFNSPLLVTIDSIAKNGAVQFVPGNTLLEGKVYYWRTAQLFEGTPGDWNNASFTYLPTSSNGSNQGHYFQHTQSNYERMFLDSTDRLSKFNSKFNNLYISHGIYPTSGSEDSHFSITPNGITNIYSACIGTSIIINVFDSLSFLPFVNPAQVNGPFFGCGANQPGRIYNYEFKYFPADNRKRIMDFIDSLPKGQFVSARLVVDPPHDSLQAQYWKRDTTLYGSGNSLYHKLVAQGFAELDSLNVTRTFSFVFKKDDTVSFKPQYVFSDGIYDRPVLSVDLPMTDTAASVTSPWFGPALQWDSLSWTGLPIAEPNGAVSDTVYTVVLGKNISGTTDTIFVLNKLQSHFAFTGTDTIDAKKYRYLKLVQTTADSDNATPFQLDYWRLNFVPAPEGAMMPGSYFEFTKDTATLAFKDTLQSGTDTLRFGIAFTNLSSTNYPDSLQATIHLEDSLGHIIPLVNKKLKPLAAADSLHLYFETPLDSISGSWKLYAAINAKGEQPEISITNNFIYHPFFVKAKVLYPANLRVFNGNGNWSDSSKWTPFGLPLCTDRVIINGQCLVDISDAVSDSLMVADTGSLTMSQPASMLNIGCSTTGGNKMMTVKGLLNVSAGTLQVNGGLLFADSSAFYQSGGTINIDPNTGDSATSLRFGLINDSLHMHPLAILSFGGVDTLPTSLHHVYLHGIVEVNGGSIHLKDPPVSDSGYAFFFAQANDFSILFDTTHQLVLGTTELNETDTSASNTFKVMVEPRGGIGSIRLGHAIVRTANVAGRKVVFAGTAGTILAIRGILLVEEGSVLDVSGGLQLKFENQQ